eukprot:176421_1
MLSTFARYSKQLHMTFKHPLARSIIITTTGFCVSDLICQSIEYKYGNQTQNTSFIWNKQRTFKFTLIGVMFGPQFHYWVPFVASLVPGHGPKVAFKRVCIDQLCMGSWATSFILSMSALLEGNDIKGIKTNLKDRFFEFYLRACCIFPPAQLINYWIIPPHYRVLWLNGIGFCWRIILSYLVYGKEGTNKEQS